MKPIKLRKIRRIDYLILSAFALVWSLMYVFLKGEFSIMLFATIALLTFATLLTRRIIIPFLIMIAGGIIAKIILSILGAITSEKILLVFVLLGAVFELLVVLTKSIIGDRMWLISLIGALAGAAVPWLLALMMQQRIKDNMMNLINSTLFYFLAGLAAGILAYMLWYSVRQTDFVLKILHKE